MKRKTKIKILLWVIGLTYLMLTVWSCMLAWLYGHDGLTAMIVVMGFIFTFVFADYSDRRLK